MKIYLAGNGIGGKPIIKEYYAMFKHRLLSFHYASDWAKRQFEHLTESLKNNTDEQKRK